MMAVRESSKPVPQSTATAEIVSVLGAALEIASAEGRSMTVILPFLGHDFSLSRQIVFKRLMGQRRVATGEPCAGAAP
jgi:hypothetical protein